MEGINLFKCLQRCETCYAKMLFPNSQRLLLFVNENGKSCPRDLINVKGRQNWLPRTMLSLLLYDGAVLALICQKKEKNHHP